MSKINSLRICAVGCIAENGNITLLVPQGMTGAKLRQWKKENAVIYGAFKEDAKGTFIPEKRKKPKAKRSLYAPVILLMNISTPTQKTMQQTNQTDRKTYNAAAGVSFEERNRIAAYRYAQKDYKGNDINCYTPSRLVAMRRTTADTFSPIHYKRK